MSSEIIIIAAMSRNKVIGKDNKLPWVIKEDMQHFKELTKGWPCIMGRKTWESLPKKPLPGRLNVVVSRGQGAISNEQLAMNNEQGAENREQRTENKEQGTIICSSLQAAIERCLNYEKAFIIGGESIYKQAMEIANKIELTLIHKDYDGDTFFPEIDPAVWKISNKIDNDYFSFITYNKK